jgi:hypothetical protein
MPNNYELLQIIILLYIISYMLTSNPFRDRTFSGATSNTQSISSGY